MNKLIKILIGLVILLVPLALVLPGMPLQSWGISAIELIKGGITIIVVMAGLTILVMGLDELKN